MKPTLSYCVCLLMVAPVLAWADQPPEPARATSELMVALTRCDRGEAVKCFESADDVERHKLVLRRAYMPEQLRKRGWTLLADQCDDGQAESCVRYAERLIADGDIRPALDKLARACELEHASACLNLANRLSTGDGVKKHAQRALKYFDRACEAGSARGCVQLADHIGTSRPADRARVIKLHRKACKADDAIGCTRSAKDRRAAGDRLGAYLDYFRACELDHVESCYTAGTLSDYPERARWLFLLACKGGLGKGCNKLSDLLLTDKGGSREWGKAIEFAEKACTLDRVSPCKRAAQIRRNPPDWRCKNELECERLCREGIGKSCQLYASYLDEETAAFELGCEAGDQDSCKRRKPAPRKPLLADDRNERVTAQLSSR